MTTSNIPSDKRRPGTFQTFDYFSGARGQVALPRALAIIGSKLTGAEATNDEPIRVGSEAEADAAVGVGTFLAIAAKTAMAACRALKSSPPAIYLVPVAEASGGTKAIHRFAVTVTTAEAGDLRVQVCGRTITVAVADAAAQNTIAADLVAAINAKAAELPVTAANSTNQANLTVNVKGIVGQEVRLDVIETPTGVSVAVSNPTPGVGVADYGNALDALGSQHYFSVALEDDDSTILADLEDHLDDVWGPGRKRYRHAFTATRDTVGNTTTLSEGLNRPEIVVSAYRQAKSFPCEIAAAVGAMRLTRERPNYNWDGTEIPLYGPDDSDGYSDDEVETLLAAGVTPLTKTATGKAKVERLVTTKSSESSIPFENLLDLAVSWTMAFYALQLDARLSRAIRGKSLDENLLNDLGDIAYATLKEGEELGDLHKVDEHKDEIVVDSHPSVPTRALVEVPQSVVPNAHQVDATHRLFVEGA